LENTLTHGGREYQLCIIWENKQMKTVREKGGKCAREFKDKVEKKCKRR
jgi:hypothetical protein